MWKHDALPILCFHMWYIYIYIHHYLDVPLLYISHIFLYISYIFSIRGIKTVLRLIRKTAYRNVPYTEILFVFTIAPRVRLLYRYKTALLHGLLNWVIDWYTYVYIYCWEIRPCCLTIWLYFLERNYFVMNLLIFIHFFQLPFGSDMLLSCITLLV